MESTISPTSNKNYNCISPIMMPIKVNEIKKANKESKILFKTFGGFKDLFTLSVRVNARISIVISISIAIKSV